MGLHLIYCKNTIKRFKAFLATDQVKGEWKQKLNQAFGRIFPRHHQSQIKNTT